MSKNSSYPGSKKSSEWSTFGKIILRWVLLIIAAFVLIGYLGIRHMNKTHRPHVGVPMSVVEEAGRVNNGFGPRVEL